MDTTNIQIVTTNTFPQANYVEDILAKYNIPYAVNTDIINQENFYLIYNIQADIANTIKQKLTDKFKLINGYVQIHYITD